MMNNLQLVLINMQFLYTEVSQGSVATCLRCGGIFNNQFVMQSLLSPTVKELWKSVNIFQSYYYYFF